MNTAKKRPGLLVLLGCALVLTIFVASGCKKKSEPAAPSPEKAASVISQQTICPVMGNKIDKNVFVEYKGKKVYFCCPDCKAKFEADPEKYIAKLPQFKQ